MISNQSIQRYTALFLVLVLSLLNQVSAAGSAAKWDAGDTIALLIGLVLLFVAICAGLGWYSRRS